MQKTTLVDYRAFRFRKRNDPEFAHLKLLLFWPIHGLIFSIIERFWIRDHYFPMHCAVDDAIPFNEFFLIPYLFWFVFLTGFILYALFWDIEAFKKLMTFIIFSYSTALLIYILFPNCQELRPTVFLRDNVLTRFLAAFYQFDTNTNVFPSIHVIGSVAVTIGAWRSKHFGSLGWRIALVLTAMLISISTLFLKQHSFLDVLGAIPVCLIAYYAAYRQKRRRPRMKTEKRENKRNQWDAD